VTQIAPYLPLVAMAACFGLIAGAGRLTYVYCLPRDAHGRPIRGEKLPVREYFLGIFGSPEVRAELGLREYFLGLFGSPEVRAELGLRGYFLGLFVSSKR